MIYRVPYDKTPPIYLLIAYVTLFILKYLNLHVQKYGRFSSDRDIEREGHTIDRYYRVTYNRTTYRESLCQD